MIDISLLTAHPASTSSPQTDARLWAIPRLLAGSGDVQISEGSLEPSDYCYLGYPMMLSPVEVYIVRVLLAHTQEVSSYASETGSPYLSVATLTALCDRCHPDDSKEIIHSMTPGQLAVHVRRINRKALDTGGRRLILSHRNDGYRLNPYM